MKLKYACPHCVVNSYSKYWNEETSKRYGEYGDICKIQENENNSYHICPECKQESEMYKGQLIIESNKAKLMDKEGAPK